TSSVLVNQVSTHIRTGQMYVIAANKLSVLLMKEKVSKAFNRATGGIFIGFGLSLIASNKA
ncbi:hypothetical protein ACED23_25445, partial [Vibrio splendidus]